MSESLTAAQGAPGTTAAGAGTGRGAGAGGGEAHFDAVIVGGGPRGVATVIRTAARLAARAEDGTLDAGTQPEDDRLEDDQPEDDQPEGAAQEHRTPLRIAIVDALEVGPGATWLTTQPPQYLNNTTASATALYPDASTPMSGPPSPGPTLVEWMAQVAADGAHPAGDWVAAEAAGLRALDFTSRRLQGVYYRDQLDAAADSPHVELTEIVATAVELEPGSKGSAGASSAAEPDRHSTDDGFDALPAVVLADGRRLRAPTLVLAQGMVQALPDAEVAALADFASVHGLRYVPPGMPAERDFRELPAGRTVLARGLGANFFDVMGDLAAEWGGTFEEVPGDPHGRLRYVPTGAEPRLVVGSGRGMPYRSKPEPYSPEREFVPRWASRAWFAELADRGGLDFAADVWPVIAREIADQYLSALAQWAPEALRDDLRPEAHRELRDTAAPAEGVEGVESAGPGAHAPTAAAWVPLLEACRTAAEVERVLLEAVTSPRWSWVPGDLRRPTRGEAVSPADWARFVDRLVTDELASMSEAAVHPRAAVNRVMSVLRGPAQQLGAVGAVSGVSLLRDLHGWFDADGLFLASGPPSVRVRQVLALIEAGIVDLLGPETVVTADAELGRFRAESRITGRSAESAVLLEIRMSKGKVPHTDDPLLRALLSTGRARIHAVDGVPTDYVEASPAEVSEAAAHGHNLVAADGEANPAVVVLGIPASTTQPGSAIGATPHKPSPLLAGADVAAKQIVQRASHAAS